MTDITPIKKTKKSEYKRIHADIYSSDDEDFHYTKKIRRNINTYHDKDHDKQSDTHPDKKCTETEYRKKIINTEWAQIFTLTDQIKKLVRSRPENFNLMIQPLQQQRRIHIKKLERIDHWEAYDAEIFVFEKNNYV